MANQDNRPQGQYTPTQGNTSGVNDSPTQGPYAQRNYQKPPDTTGPMQGAADVPATPPAPQQKSQG